MAAMRRERAETGKVSSPGHAKGPREHVPEGVLGWAEAGGLSGRGHGKGPAPNGRGHAHQDDGVVIVARVWGEGATAGGGCA